jgi:hypothetical protein
MKTPEEMAEEYAELMSFDVRGHQRGFVAGYKAAKDQLAEMRNHLEKAFQAGHLFMATGVDFDEWYARVFLAKQQLADVDKVTNSSNNSNSWISVKERLPEIGEYVLITHRTSEDYASLKVMEATRISDGEYEIWGDHGILADYVDYWMPMPKAPKEEK